MERDEYLRSAPYLLYEEVTAAWLAHDKDRLLRAVEQLKGIGEIAPTI